VLLVHVCRSLRAMSMCARDQEFACHMCVREQGFVCEKEGVCVRVRKFCLREGVCGV